MVLGVSGIRMGGCPGRRVLAGESSTLVPDGVMDAGVYPSHRNRMGKINCSRGENSEPVRHDLFRGIRCSRTRSLQRGIVRLRVGVAHEGRGDLRSRRFDRAERELAETF